MKCKLSEMEFDNIHPGQIVEGIIPFTEMMNVSKNGPWFPMNYSVGIIAEKYTKEQSSQGEDASVTIVWKKNQKLSYKVYLRDCRNVYVLGV